MGVLAAIIASVAGCVGMPSNGPAAQATASPQSTSPAVNLIGLFPSGPQPGADPSQIVQGFLIAGASYPTYTIADQYLVSSAAKTWNPSFAVTVFSNNPTFTTVIAPRPSASPKGGRAGVQQASVEVSGKVQASFNGSGQYYVSAQSQDQDQGRYPFNLVKANGQWRIMNPPDYRMLPATDFPFFYKAQDLYFFASDNPMVLVPDSVFVPQAATFLQLLHNLVSALVKEPETPWLEGATQTGFPGGKVEGVMVDGSNVTVNLSGVARTNPKLQQFAAQLVWTLTAPPSSSPASQPNIQSVVLNVDGQPWTPSTAPCADGRSPGPFQTQAAYECYDPYPSAPASFYYVNGGQAWARCGSQLLGAQGEVGPVVPLVTRIGAFASQGCGDAVAGPPVREGNQTPPATQPPTLPTVTMTAVSPGGNDVAIVAKGNLYVGPLSSQPASLLKDERLTGGGITALSFDRNGNLWVVQSGDIVMLPSTGKGQVQVNFPGNVSDLSVAPDGVRIAFIGQIGDAEPEVYLAAIGGGPPNSDRLPSSTTHLDISTYAALAPNVINPGSVAWYDADDLIVLNDAPGDNTLWEAPVDGQPAQPEVIPPDATSITAAGRDNTLVAGLSGGDLSVSTSLEGPWYTLGEPGQYPSYPG
jgi:Lipoprotein LpqB beta-propeller domain/Sporulation and spore germination